MSRCLGTLIVLVSLFVTTPLWAAQLSRPQVEYSADSVMQTEDTTTEQHVYVTPTKERHEMLSGSGDTGIGSIQIFRHDSKVMWQLMPSEKMYMEHSMGKAAAKDISQWDFEESVMGNEVLNGVNVTKYKTIATSTDGKKYGGFSWRTKEGISIKSDLLYKEGNEKKRMMTELKNLKVGKQDPKLFEVPEGFTKFDMAGMMGGMGGMMGREGMGQPPTDRPGSRNKPTVHQPGVNVPQENVPVAPEPEPPADDRSEMQKAGDMMKKLFGQ
ncbi:MAG: DUF4412 domain-containing protein [Nitrospirota bacterium]